MTQILMGGVVSNTTSTGATSNTPIGSGSCGSNATEANVQTTWRTAGTFSNLYCRVTTNAASTAASSVFYRVGGVNGNQSLNIPLSTNGEFTDSTNSDAVSAGNQINLQTINGGGGNLSISAHALQFSPTNTTDTVNKYTCNGTFSSGVASTSFYQTLGGQLSTAATTTTEANTQFKFKITATLQNLFAFVVTNGRATSSTICTRIGGADGNCTISTGTGGATGVFEDTSHTDSISSGNLVNYVVRSSTGAGTLAISNVGIDCLNSSSLTHYISNNAPSYFSQTSGTSQNLGFCGGTSIAGVSTAARTKMQVSFTASNLEGFCVTNTDAGPTMSLAVSGSAVNSTINFGGVTGYAEDTTHSDAFTSSSEVSILRVTTTGAAITGNHGFLATYPAPPSAIGWFPIYVNQVPFFVQQIPAGQAVEPIQPLNFRIPWLPTLPDQQRPNLKVQRDFIFDRPLALSLPIKWLPQYIDLPRPNLKVQRDFVFDHPYALNFNIPWLPDYPNQWPFFNQQLPSGMVEPIQPLRFTTPQQPIYIDLPRLNLKVQRDFIFGPPPQTIAAVASIPWFPVCPDLYRESPRVKGNSFFAPPWTLNFRMPWLPVYNDQQRLNLKVQRDFVFDHPLPLDLRLPWLPDYPNQVPFFVQQIPAGEVMPVLPLNVRLPWLPQYADQVRLNLKVQRDFVFMPVLALRMPLPWLPLYADQQRLNLKVQREFIFDYPQPFNFIMPWLPQYPNQVPFFTQQIPAGEVAPIEPLNFTISWLPRHPDQWPFFNQQLPSGQVFMPPLRIIFPTPPWFPQYPNNIPGNPLQPSLVSGYIGFIPAPPSPFGKLIFPRHRNRTLQLDPKSVILEPKHRGRVI